MQCLLSVFTFCSIWLVHSTAGDCGFPGQPLNGLEDIFYGTDRVKNEEFRNGSSVRFQCSNLHLMVGENVRTCQSNGTWSNAVPQCTTNVAERIHLTAENLSPYSDNVSMLIDGRESVCHVQFQSNTSLVINPKRPIRLYAIKFVTFGSDETFLSRAKWSLTFANHSGSSVSIEATIHHDDHYLITLDRNVSDLSWDALVIKQVGRVSFNLCEMEVHAFQDECGHPEMPINGRFLRSNDSVTYFCNAGYRLSADSPVTRRCSRGVWSGNQPICETIAEPVQNPKPSVADECGLPEVPINGRFLRSNDSVTYFCNAGYRLSTDSPVTRHCSRGVWSGNQPTCVETMAVPVIAAKVYLPAMICVLIIAAFILGSSVLVYMRKRKKCKGMVACLMNNEVCTASSHRESTPLSFYNRL